MGFSFLLFNLKSFPFSFLPSTLTPSFFPIISNWKYHIKMVELKQISSNFQEGNGV